MATPRRLPRGGLELHLAVVAPLLLLAAGIPVISRPDNGAEAATAPIAASQEPLAAAGAEEEGAQAGAATARQPPPPPPPPLPMGGAGAAPVPGEGPAAAAGEEEEGEEGLGGDASEALAGDALSSAAQEELAASDSDDAGRGEEAAADADAQHQKRRSKKWWFSGPTCTGTGPFPPSARCYTGSRMGEQVAVKVYGFNQASGTGLVAFTGSGLKSIACKKPFTVSVQHEVSVLGLKQCLPSTVRHSHMKYCSDQDAFVLDAYVTVIPEELVLSRSACPAVLLSLGEGAEPLNRTAGNPSVTVLEAFGGEGRGRPDAPLALMRREAAARHWGGGGPDAE